MTYQECEEYLYNIPKFSDAEQFNKSARFYEYLRRPGENSKIIHVAGTNGKGSVCNFLRYALTESGYKVALFTSPHLISMCERMSIDGNNISENIFSIYFEKLLKKLKQYNLDYPKENYKAGFFDYFFFVAMGWFEEKKPDFIILETGLGGRLDTTNIVKNKCASIISQIDFDHMEYLGNTLSQIAREKAGIISNKVPIITMNDNQEVLEIIKKTAIERESCFISVKKSDVSEIKKHKDFIDFSYSFKYHKSYGFTVRSLADYQIYNAALALGSLEIVLKDMFDYDKISAGISKMFWPCRMERILNNVIIDGAHNPNGIEALIKSIESMKERKMLLFSVVNDKDYDNMIKLISNENSFEKVVITRIADSRGEECRLIEEKFRESSSLDIIVVSNPVKAFEYAYKHLEGRILIVAGSLYLAGTIRKYILDNYKN